MEDIEATAGALLKQFSDFADGVEAVTKAAYESAKLGVLRADAIDQELGQAIERIRALGGDPTATSEVRARYRQRIDEIHRQLALLRQKFDGARATVQLARELAVLLEMDQSGTLESALHAQLRIAVSAATRAGFQVDPNTSN